MAISTAVSSRTRRPTPASTPARRRTRREPEVGVGDVRDQQQRHARDEQRLQHGLEAARAVADERHVGEQHQHPEDGAVLVAEHAAEQPECDCHGRHEDDEAEELAEQRRGPAVLLGDGVDHRPQEVRVTLDPFAGVEHQAVAPGQVLGVPVGDERVVLDEPEHPGQREGQHVEPTLDEAGVGGGGRREDVGQPTDLGRSVRPRRPRPVPSLWRSRWRMVPKLTRNADLTLTATIQPVIQPAIMGVLNVTPDSFSDGGRYDTVDAAVAARPSDARRGCGDHRRGW